MKLCSSLRIDATVWEQLTPEPGGRKHTSGLKTGVKALLALLLLTVAGVAAVGVRSYDGHCISFEPPKRPCSLIEFLIPYTLTLAMFSLIGKPIRFLSLTLILLAPLLIGYLFSSRSGNAAVGSKQDALP